MKTKEQIKAEIDTEGFAYWLTDYYDPKDINDPKLKELLTRTRDALLEAELNMRNEGYFP